MGIDSSVNARKHEPVPENVESLEEIRPGANGAAKFIGCGLCHEACAHDDCDEHAVSKSVMSMSTGQLLQARLKQLQEEKEHVRRELQTLSEAYLRIVREAAECKDALKGVH